jgi:hypothetical protein
MTKHYELSRARQQAVKLQPRLPTRMTNIMKLSRARQQAAMPLGAHRAMKICSSVIKA